ncbi:MAG: YdbL family protein [Alphaproteobacteria bacterium]|nr:YdbL family protein [Alphaproteobacteria bacterium]MCK5555826.1 YdbL family protein [Alphaproteobacteria bacterium]
MKLRFISMIVALSVLLAFPAFALDLHQARDAGILGEKNDGYVAVLKKTPEAEALAKDINKKRAQEYERISKQNDQPVKVISNLAAKQIAKGINAGNKYQDTNGNWKTR